MMFEIRRPIVLDYETFFSDTCSIKAKKGTDWVGGNYSYVTHKDFYCYMLSWFDLTTGQRGVIDDRSKFPEFINTLRGRTVVAHNAGFEFAVSWSIDKTFAPLNMFDTSDMSQYFQAPRNLEGAAHWLLGRKIDKGMRDFMKGKHYRDIGVDAQKAMREYALDDANSEAELFQYGADKWPQLEQWMSDYTRRQNWAGVHIDRDYLEEQIDLVNATRSKAMHVIPWVETDEDKPLSAKKLAVWCREQGIDAPASLAEDSEECQAWEDKYGDQFPVVGAMRDFRKSNTYFKKLNLIGALLRPDGTMPLETMYAAAPHTLRFSARKFNFQSLPREKTYCDLRGCLVPPPGHKFVGADLSGIEARGLLWLAGDMDYLEQVAALDAVAAATDQTGGGDIYSPSARRLFGYSDPRPLKETDPDLRFATKTCVLQLGFQSGAKKFHWYISNNVKKQVLDRVRIGEESDEELALRLVQLYRVSNPKVQNLWYSLDRELRTACTAGNTFKIQLPNGRTINYFDLALRDSVDTQGRPRVEVVGSVCLGEERKKLYGGKLTENTAQGMARDVLVQSIYNLDKAGFPTNFSVHDENVVVVPDDQATRDTCREIERIMSITPDWAPGLPLAAETSLMSRYAK